MSLRLTKPGMPAAGLVYPPQHSMAGQPVEPLYVRADGSAVWPALGGSEDPDDPAFTGEGDDDSDDDDSEDDQDDDEDDKSRRKTRSKRSSKSDDDEDEDEDDDEGSGPSKAARQAKRYRLKLREEERKNADMAARLKALEDGDKPVDEIMKRDLAEAKGQVESLTEVNRVMQSQLAFFKTPVPGIEWVDASDAFALAEREGLFDDVIDEDGTVDTRELRRSLKDLAKRKPHLVKKSQTASRTKDDDDDSDDDEPRSRRSGSTMNTTRRGKKNTEPTRAELAKKFPILGRV